MEGVPSPRDLYTLAWIGVAGLIGLVGGYIVYAAKLRRPVAELLVGLFVIVFVAGLLAIRLLLFRE